MSNAQSTSRGGPDAVDRRGSGASDEDLRMLVNTLLLLSDHDFRDYAPSWLNRRIRHRVSVEGIETIEELRDKILRDQACRQRLLASLSLHVSSMFRDPLFFGAFRQKAVPLLRTFPFLRFWVAGCSRGEEVYSLAILLHEEGLYDRSTIYGTDISEEIVTHARSRSFPVAAIDEYSRNYQSAGGQGQLSDYFTRNRDSVVFEEALARNVVFATHNLARDKSFNEFQVIFCRNVLIYFNRTLQRAVHNLFYESLDTFGYLGLGRSESIRFSPHEISYQSVSASVRLYRKVM